MSDSIIQKAQGPSPSYVSGNVVERNMIPHCFHLIKLSDAQEKVTFNKLL